jgi:hypothetical protein
MYGDKLESFLLELGFSKQDIWMLLLCPLCSVFGSIINIFSIDMDLNEPLNKGNCTKGFENNIFYWEWFFRRIFIGMITGLIIALYFVGALTSSSTTIARILAFSILIGYASPKFWIAQEKILISLIESRLKILLNQSLDTSLKKESDKNVDKSE